jgi:hypothetical protein
MKLLASVLLLLLSISSYCQKSKQKTTLNPFLNIEGNLIKYDDMSAIPGGSLSIGMKASVGGIGIGALVTQFKDDNRVYVPVFIDFIVYPQFKTVEPFMKLRVGQGVYNIKERYSAAGVNITSDVKGKLFLSPALGIRFPSKKAGINVGVAYIHSYFSSSITSSRSNYKNQKDYETDAFLLSFGFTI